MKITESFLRKIVKQVMIESMSLSSLEHDDYASLMREIEHDIYSLMQDIEDAMSQDDSQMNDVRKSISFISEMFPLEFEEEPMNSLLYHLEKLGNFVSSADSLDDETKEDLVSELKQIHDYILYDLMG